MYSVGLLGREERPGLADHDGQLQLVVELVRHALGVHDRIAGPDDRVDVLEEHDPRQHGVRPVDARRLLVVLAEVARRVEELLRDQRRTQAHLVERQLAPGRVDVAAELEVAPHVRHVELDHPVSDDLSDALVVEGKQLHLDSAFRDRDERQSTRLYAGSIMDTVARMLYDRRRPGCNDAVGTTGAR